MVSKRERAKKAFDADAFQREAEATLAGLTDAEIEAIHLRADVRTTRSQLEEADEIARKFFEELRDGRKLSRSARTPRRAPTR